MNEQSARTDTYAGNDLEALSNLRRYRAWIVDSFRPHLGGRTAEIGAGTGSISELLLPLTGSLELIEPSSNLALILERKFSGEQAVEVHHDTFEAWIENAPAQIYDSLVMVSVLEHIENDSGAIREMFRILKPGGHLFLFVPALKFLFSDLDALVGHFRRYALGELRRSVDAEGFEVVSARYFDALGMAPWWLMNKVFGATEFNPGLAKIYDLLAVPVTRTIELLITPPLGKNIILVARRPDGLPGQV